MLEEITLFGKVDKAQIAIDRLRAFQRNGEPYYLAFSGGKDSIVILQLAKEAGVPFDAVHNLTTIDPPEVVWTMRKYYPEVKIERPEIPFLKMLVSRGFPQRMRRWCCAEYKERGGEGRVVLTGVRWEESFNRSKRKMTEACILGKGRTFVHPIIDWSESEVWEFIRSRNLPYPNLYDRGWKRVGCLFCPFAGSHRSIALSTYPKYADLFRKAFRKLFSAKKEKGLTSCDRWGSGDEMFEWWINEDRAKEENPDQTTLF